MLYQKITKTVLALTLLSTTALATETPCDFNTNDQTIYEGTIDSVRVVDKKVEKYVADTFKCTMSIEGRVRGQWYPANASYIYGPDVSQENACTNAENRAKKSILRKFVPETLKSEKNLKCDLTKVKKSCKVVYINALVGEFGKQRIRMVSCDEK